MNKKWFIIKIIITLILFIIAICLVVLTFNNGFKMSESNANNLFSFIGTLIGSIISLIGAFIVLYITMKKNNEQQVRLFNEQNSIQVENNLQQKYTKEREIFNETYNSIEQFLIISQTYKIDSNSSFVDTINRLNLAFTEYKKSMNLLLISTNVYSLKDKCINCSLCDVKSYGELSRVLKDIQAIIMDYEDVILKIHLIQNEMFDLAIRNKERIDRKSILENIVNNNTVLLNYSSEVKELTAKINKANQEIIDINISLQKDFDIINEKNSNISQMIGQLSKIQPKFFNKIMEYFDVVTFYIKEQVCLVKKNGRKLSSKCKKYDLNDIDKY